MEHTMRAMSERTSPKSSWDARVEEFAQNVQLLEPSEIRSRIEDLRGSLFQKGVDLTAPCSALTPEQMAAINEVLHVSQVQVRESEGEALELTTTSYTRDGEIPDEAIVTAGFLFCWLLSSDINVKSVTVRYTLILIRLPSALRLAFASNSSVRSLRAQLWVEDSRQHGSFLAEGLHRSATSLEVYDVDGLEFTDEAAARTAAVFRRCSDTLREVSLRSGPTATTSESAMEIILEALVGSPTLTTLTIIQHTLGKEGGRAVVKLLQGSAAIAELKLVNVGEEALQVITSGLNTNSSLKRLEVGNNVQSDSWAYKLADAIREHQSIETLTVHGSYEDNNINKALADVLKFNRTLKELTVGVTASDEGMVAYADAILTNQTLEKLVLSCYSISPAAIQHIAEALQSNKSLTLLKLDGDSKLPSSVLRHPHTYERMELTRDDDGLRELARVLNNGANIPELYLKWNYDFSSLYLGQVFHALGSNPHVTHLFIGMADYIDIYAARLLSDAFKRTKTLQSVHCQYEIEDPNVVLTLLTGLAVNKSIRKVNFGCAFLYRPIPEVLGKLMKVNNTLRSLRISDCSLRSEKMKPILEGLSVNYTLTSVDLGEMDSHGSELFQVQEFVRRNRRLLNRAVKFVLGTSTDSESQEAFRKLNSSMSLLEEVAKVGRVPQPRVADLMHTAEQAV